MEEVKIGSVTTAIYSKKGRSPHPLKFIVLPGNPGVLDFYCNFIDGLYEKLDGKFDVYGVGHAGHNLPRKNGDKIFTLEEQIQHKIDFLETFENIQNCRFVLLGHSVGSYIALKIMIRRPDITVVHSFHLFPTFRHLWEGLTLSKKIMVQPGIRHSLSNLVHYAPLWLKRHLIRYSKELVEEAQYLAVENTLAADYYVLMNALTMAHIETLEICDLEEEVKDLISTSLERMMFLYGPNDLYAPKGYYEELKEIFPEVNAHLAPDEIPHAFVTTHHSEVNNILGPWLKQISSSGVATD